VKADYLLNLTALHFLHPDVNLVLEPISTYGAVGPYSFLFIAALLGSGLAALALMLGFLAHRAFRIQVQPP
jgi:hypothetical protein